MIKGYYKGKELNNYTKKELVDVVVELGDMYSNQLIIIDYK